MEMKMEMEMEMEMEMGTEMEVMPTSECCCFLSSFGLSPDC